MYSKLQSSHGALYGEDLARRRAVGGAVRTPQVRPVKEVVPLHPELQRSRLPGQRRLEPSLLAQAPVRAEETWPAQVAAIASVIAEIIRRRIRKRLRVVPQQSRGV